MVSTLIAYQVKFVWNLFHIVVDVFFHSFFPYFFRFVDDQFRGGILLIQSHAIYLLCLAAESIFFFRCCSSFGVASLSLSSLLILHFLHTFHHRLSCRCIISVFLFIIVICLLAVKLNFFFCSLCLNLLWICSKWTSPNEKSCLKIEETNEKKKKMFYFMAHVTAVAVCCASWWEQHLCKQQFHRKRRIFCPMNIQIVNKLNFFLPFFVLMKLISNSNSCSHYS